MSPWLWLLPILPLAVAYALSFLMAWPQSEHGEGDWN